MSKKRFVPPPEYTQIPNVLLDEVLPVASDAEWKVVCAIARKTFGWGIEERLMTNAEIRELTGLSRQGVTNGIQRARERGFVGRRKAGANKFLYGIRVEAANEVNSSPSGELPTSCTPETERGTRSRPLPIQGKKDLQEKEKLQSAKNRASAKKVDSEMVKRIFTYWLKRTQREGKGYQLTNKRRGAVAMRLKDSTPDEIKLAIDGNWADDYLRENGHTDLELICRSRDHVEKYRDKAPGQRGGKPDRSQYNTTKPNPELEGGAE